jgi:hypothetical protein
MNERGWQEAQSVGARPGTRTNTATTDHLGEVRASATSWQSAQIGIIGLIAVVGVVKGGDDLRKLPDDTAVLIGVLLGLAFLAAITAIYLVSFIAYRLPRFGLRIAQDADVVAWTATEKAAKRLRTGVMLTFAAALLVAAAVALTWYVDDEATTSLARVVTEERTYCGDLVGADTSRAIVVERGERVVAVDPVSLTPVDACP